MVDGTTVFYTLKEKKLELSYGIYTTHWTCENAGSLTTFFQKFEYVN